MVTTGKGTAIFLEVWRILEKEQNVSGLVSMLSLAVWLILSPSLAIAQMDTLSVTITFRERIALPSGAQLEVQILGVAEAEAQSGTIASQRFAMTAVPMTVSLTYDPQVVEDGLQYGVFAAIWTPDGTQMFRASKMFDTTDGSIPPAFDIMLTMRPEAEMTATAPRRISGVPWAVTEVFGETWPNDDPATLVVDDNMNFAIFGGCNRFSGQITPSVSGLAFPENIAGTLMACPDEIEGLERRFLAALRQVADHVRYGAGLVMTDAQGRAVLHFVERPE